MVYTHYMNPKPKPGATPIPARRLIIPPISPAASGPLYQQIVDGVKREISAGRLEPGDALPSFRTLAEDLLVSLITVKRAYEELEREGVVFSKQGLGTFVSDNGLARSREMKRDHTEALLRDALREGEEAGLTPNELIALMKQLAKEKEG
ncbi:MAG: GntR family transcriptional regulator [Candidatus Hydrogenedentes bacterium]|nr:GntR family transcriptional regulator [Candidatus Hydrogenedentota bacterium]